MGFAASKTAEITDVFEDIKREKQISRADFKIIQTFSNKNNTHCYLVEKIDTKVRYVMKVMDKFALYNKGCIPNILREIKLLSQVSHPFIIPLYYAFQDYSSLYYISELVRGGDLGFQMKFHQSFDEAETKFIASCLILALEKLHSLGYAIVGLTIDHILLDAKGYPRIIGFMDSIVVSDDNKNDSALVLHDDLITEYLAPEVLMRKQPSFEADYYSLGMIIYEMMEGRRGMNQEVYTREQLIQTILNREKQVKKSDLPVGWTLDSADFINKLIKKKTSNRLGYYGIDELKKHLWLKGVAWQRIQDGIMNPPYTPKIRKIESESIFNNIKKNAITGQKPRYILELFNSLDFQEQFEKYYFSVEEKDDDQEFVAQSVDGQTDIQDIGSEKKLLS